MASLINKFGLSNDTDAFYAGLAKRLQEAGSTHRRCPKCQYGEMILDESSMTVMTEEFVDRKARFGCSSCHHEYAVDWVEQYK